MTGLYPSWSLTGIPCRMHRISFDLCPNYLSGWGTAQTVLRVLSAFANAITAALPSVGGPKEKERAWSDLYPSWSLTAIPCVALWHLASLTTNALLPLPYTRNFFSSLRAHVKLRVY
jgi:hypothetical protein